MARFALRRTEEAVRALSVGIRSELRLDGIRKVKVCTVLPAAIDTPFFQHAANTGRKVVAMPPVYTAERVAATIVSLAAKPRREAVVGPGRPAHAPAAQGHARKAGSRHGRAGGEDPPVPEEACAGIHRSPL